MMATRGALSCIHKAPAPLCTSPSRSCASRSKGNGAALLLLTGKRSWAEEEWERLKRTTLARAAAARSRGRERWLEDGVELPWRGRADDALDALDMSRERDPGEGEALREASRRAVRAFEGVESVLKQTVTRWDAAEVVEPISGKKRPKDWINLRYWAREVVGVIVREDAVRTWERIAYGDDIPDGKALLDGIMKFTLSPCTHISHEVRELSSPGTR